MIGLEIGKTVKGRILILLFLVTILLHVDATAQNGGSEEKEDKVELEDNLFKANFLSPGFSYERKVYGHMSVNGELSLGVDLFGYLGFGGIGVSTGSNLGIQPNAELQYRVYLNMNARERKGKSTFANTGTYLALNLVQRGNQIWAVGGAVPNGGFFYGPRIGSQQTNRSGFYYRFDVGIDFQKVNENTYMTLGSTYTLGWVLGAKNKGQQ